MKELEYPFDASYLMTHRRQLKKTLTAQSAAFTDKRIAILGGSTTAAIGWMVELFLLNQQIRILRPGPVLRRNQAGHSRIQIIYLI